MVAKKLLVPVDGSKYALRALAYAIGRAKESGAQVHVLHVERPIDYAELRVYIMRKEIRRIRREAHARILAPAISRLKTAGVPYVALARQGYDVSESIVAYVHARKIDEVVIGTHGMGALGTFVLGSVANRVVHLVRVPVTMIR